MRKLVVSPRQYSQMKRLERSSISEDIYKSKLKDILGSNIVDELLEEITEVAIDFNADKNPMFKAYFTETK